jgi:hypothetical protein
MLEFLKRLFGSRPEPPPLMVRLRTSHGVVDGKVEMTATWLPSGGTTTWTATAAQGLCIVPWRVGRRLDLTVAHATLTARLAFSAADVSHRVEEVWLADGV